VYVGVDYYPEHWPRNRWEIDAQMMQRAAFNVVRLAEFSWVKMEPQEGRYDFDWLDDAIATLGRYNLRVVLGTPTAVVPAWLALKYPEVMSLRREGVRNIWGARKDTCYCSGALRLLSARITTEMADRFGDNPNVIGWQTDNEFGGGEDRCHCGACRATWQDFLRDRYAIIERLNQAWGTHFWGHSFRAWEEIPVINNIAAQNPSACLDWQRFYSWLQVRFQHEQVLILRKRCPAHFITHNLMGFFPEINYFDLGKELDFVSWDNYPVWGEPHLRFNASAQADLMRGIKRRNFWIMEQTAGPAGSNWFQRNVRPGELRSIAYQQLAHGADGQVWFRWRTCTAGREQYWHGLLQHDGEENRRYREAAQTADEYRRLSSALEGTTVQSKVAIIFDWNSFWALRIQPGFEKNNYTEHLGRYYLALFKAGVNVDFISLDDDFSSYRLLLAPQLHVLPDALANRLEAYVLGGGVLLTDLRSVVKDETNLCHARPLPGLLSSTLGIQIPEYDILHAETLLTGEFAQCAASQYADWIVPTTAVALAGYDRWFMKPYAAVTRNAHGPGIAWYVGTIGDPGFYRQLVEKLLADAGVQPLLRPPEGVEASVREDQGKRLLFLINHTEERKTVDLPFAGHDLLGNRPTGERITLDAHGLVVMQLSR
jgi:beta-galactosidase